MTIIKQKNIYQAELKVPKIPKIYWKKSLESHKKTLDIKDAKRKELIIVAGWKQKIEIV